MGKSMQFVRQQFFTICTVCSGSPLKRVAVTSSCASILNPDSTGVLDESSWNEGSVALTREKGREAPQVEKYRASKSLAERGQGLHPLYVASTRTYIIGFFSLQPLGTLSQRMHPP